MENIFRQQIEFFKVNWVDFIFIAITLYFFITNKGFIKTLLDILGFFFALLLSYKLYSILAGFLLTQFAVPKGLANVTGYFMAWFAAEVIFSLLSIFLIGDFIKKLQKHPINIGLGYFLSVLQSSIIYLFFIGLVFALPIRGTIKEDILESRTGPFFVNASQSMEKGIKNIFGEAISETINFLTVKPNSFESLDLGFKLGGKKLNVDQQSEKTMFSLVNKERLSRGEKRLIMDENLREVARLYAKEMFVNGFFSHISQIDGSTVSERATRHNINFYIIGENLAYAPDVYLAHQGLMNSEGHRKNILYPDFSRVGIGSIDGGIYGKMFVQVFAN